jgi:hypothetical protein
MPKTIDTSSERGRLRLVVCAFAYPIAQITHRFYLQPHPGRYTPHHTRIRISATSLDPPRFPDPDVIEDNYPPGTVLVTASYNKAPYNKTINLQIFIYAIQILDSKLIPSVYQSLPKLLTADMVDNAHYTNEVSFDAQLHPNLHASTYRL